MASPQSSYGSSEEGTSSDGSDHQEVDKLPLNQALAHHDSSNGEESEEEETGDKEESEEENVLPDDNNLHPPPLQGDTVPDSESESDKSPRRSQPKRKAVDSEPVEPKRTRMAESPQPRMQSEVAEVAQIQPEVAEHALTKSDVEKLFQDKIVSYEHLGQEVLALEKKYPGFFKSPFVKLPEEKARTLNAKLQNHHIAKIKASIQLGNIRKEVTNSLINLLD
ncbi:hypothetical protein CFC21_075617 [Triticum aestivum]|uniref:Uncharacterized protein n=3 Tax=Triticinae TaxID=1648030 RepID=A0A3B6MIM8_WHEAT|nr:uncharacterized protein LOC123124124 [Triticum aestivum]KAF7070059.1 hypothetical protein CFC21_075617 [Triticum aestivum]